MGFVSFKNFSLHLVCVVFKKVELHDELFKFFSLYLVCAVFHNTESKFS